MEHQHILRFMFVPCFTTRLLVGGLGVEDRETCFSQVPIFLHVIYFWRVWAQREACLLKPRSLYEMEQQILSTFAGVPLNFLKNSVEPASSKFQKFKCKVMKSV
jgi:hypothetical protein